MKNSALKTGFLRKTNNRKPPKGTLIQLAGRKTKNAEIMMLLA